MALVDIGMCVVDRAQERILGDVSSGGPGDMLSGWQQTGQGIGMTCHTNFERGAQTYFGLPGASAIF